MTTAERASRAVATRFLLELGAALHRYGAGSPQIERVLGSAAHACGLRVHAFLLPTALFACFDEEEPPRTQLVRLEPSDVQLDRLLRVDALCARLFRGELEPEAGREELRAIERAPAPHGDLRVLLSYAVLPACFAAVLGLGGREALFAAVAGAAIGLLAKPMVRRARLARLFEPLSGFVAGALAVLAAQLFGGLAVTPAILASVIVLIPGLSFTLALRELAERHLVAGTARLMHAGISFLAIGAGCAGGYHALRLLLGEPPALEPEALPLPVAALAFLPCSLAFGPLFQAPLRELPWLVVAGAVAFGSVQTAGAQLGPELGAFLGALALGIASNLYARRFDRSATVMLLPGLLLLVPGSFGLRSLGSFFEGAAVRGIENAFAMAILGIALVLGLFLANALVPPRGLDA
ncbi:MAG: threonine/serine exporter family protein [Planctomycetes bacterium]|nr:threonine/serine exporter family protein [Planctomycetota bacterium]